VKKNKSKKTATGRPAIFATAELLQEKISNYFENCPDKKTVFFKLKDEVVSEQVQRLTISGLAYFLGFESRQSFYDYEKRGDAFSYALKRARLYIEREYEMQLDGSNAAGAIFALKNFGWSDRQEVEHSGNLSINLGVDEKKL
jgi:hypothetical protein